MKLTAQHLERAADYAAIRSSQSGYFQNMADSLNWQLDASRRQRRARAGLILEWLGLGQVILGIVLMFALGFLPGMIGISTGVIMGILGYGMGEDDA